MHLYSGVYTPSLNFCEEFCHCLQINQYAVISTNS